MQRRDVSGASALSFSWSAPAAFRIRENCFYLIYSYVRISKYIWALSNRSLVNIEHEQYINYSVRVFVSSSYFATIISVVFASFIHNFFWFLLLFTFVSVRFDLIRFSAEQKRNHITIYMNARRMTLIRKVLHWNGHGWCRIYTDWLLWRWLIN